MKIEVDLDEAFEAFCEDIRTRRYNRLTVSELTEKVFILLDNGASSYADIAAVIIEMLDRNEIVKEYVKDSLTDEESAP